MSVRQRGERVKRGLTKQEMSKGLLEERNILIPVLHVILHLLVTGLTTDQPLEREDSV